MSTVIFVWSSSYSFALWLRPYCQSDLVTLLDEQGSTCIAISVDHVAHQQRADICKVFHVRQEWCMLHSSHTCSFVYERHSAALRSSPRVSNFLVSIYLYWGLAKNILGMENNHLSNSALKFAKLAKNSNVPTVLFLAEKRHDTSLPLHLPSMWPFFSHGEDWECIEESKFGSE